MDWDYPFDKPEGAVLLMGLFSDEFYVKSWSSISGIFIDMDTQMGRPLWLGASSHVRYPAALLFK